MADDDDRMHEAVEIEDRASLEEIFKKLAEENKSVAGVTITPENSLQCSAVLCAVRVLSEAVASLPFNLMRYLPEGGSEIAATHALQEILAYQPNSWMTSFEWREWMQSQTLLWGNAYCRIIGNARKGSVSELIPMHASRMKVVQLTNRKLRYEFTHPDNPAEPEKFTQDEIFHIRWLSSDGIMGYIPPSLARDAIALARATEIHSSAFFGNGAQAGAYIQCTQPQKPESMDRLKRSYENAHGGPYKAFRTMMLPYGYEKKHDPVNNQHAELIATRRYQVEEIARQYRVPMHLMGDLSNVRHETVEQSGIDFVTFSLSPWLKRWAAAVRRDLITDYKNYFAAFDPSELIVGDHEAKSAWVREGFNMGMLDVDEGRRIGYNLNPLPNGAGKKRFVQVNMSLLEAFTEESPSGVNPTKESEKPAAAAGDTEVDAEDEDTPTRAAATIIFKSTLRKLAAVEADGILQRREKAEKLQSWLDEHQARMKIELADAGEALGMDVDAFVNRWMVGSKSLLLECHRSGKPYEEVTEKWMERVKLN